jgi:hypothetical protein
LAAFYGARIAQKIGKRVTHVIVDPQDLSRLPEIRKANLVCFLSRPICSSYTKKYLQRWLKKPPYLAKHVVTFDWLVESCNSHEGIDCGWFLSCGVLLKRPLPRG